MLLERIQVALCLLAVAAVICGALSQAVGVAPDEADVHASLVRLASEPLASKWVSERVLQSISDPEVVCENVLLSIDWVILNFHKEFNDLRTAAHTDQDQLISDSVSGVINAHQFFWSPGFRKLLEYSLTAHRLGQHTLDFITTLALLHGDRCFTPQVRTDLASAVMSLSETAKKAHLLQFALAFKGVFSFWDESTDVLRHVKPVWEVISGVARVAEALGAVRIMLAEYRTVGEEEWKHMAGPPEWEAASGEFSEMHFMQRQFMGGWHLDFGLAASLIRLWRPPSQGSAPEDGCHTSIVDFGAGSGHYCKFLNQTGEYCCSAYDGSAHAPKLTEGMVQTQRLDEHFDLGRTFDWVMCLEVAEHIPIGKEAALLGNLRRHAKIGLVLSWSEEAGGAHINARPWHVVRKAVEAVGFVLDSTASAELRPQVAWMRGAVHVFRTT